MCSSKKKERVKFQIRHQRRVPPTLTKIKQKHQAVHDCTVDSARCIVHRQNSSEQYTKWKSRKISKLNVFPFVTTEVQQRLRQEKADFFAAAVGTASQYDLMWF